MATLKSFDKSFSHTFFDEQTLCYDDLVNLKPGAWLNDNCINAYLVYLQNDKFKGRTDVTFLAPSTAYWILMAPTDDDIREAVEPMKLDEKELIFVPVNNNPNFEQMAGGSHWSLVMYRKSDDTFYTYDSHGNTNASWAKRTAEIMQRAVLNRGSAKPRVVARDTPQQQNSCDCGLFVIALSEYLADRGGDDKAVTKDVTAA